MSLQTVLYLLPYIISVLLCAGVGVYALSRRTVPGATPFAWTALLPAISTVAYMLELLSPSLRAKIFWDDVQFWLLAAAPLVLLAFVFQYTGRRPVRPRRTFGLLAAPIVLFLLLLATDDVHGLVRPEAWLVPGQPFSALMYDFTPTVQALALYGFGLVVASLALLVRFFVRSPRLYRMQIGIIMVGTLFPLAGTGLTLAGVSLGFHRDTAPVTAAIRSVLIGWALFRYHLLDVVPVAWNMVIEKMTDAVIVVDAQFRIVDLNPAARRLSGSKASEMIGRPAARALAGWPDLAGPCQEGTTGQREVVLAGPGGARHFDLICVPLQDQRGQLAGYVLVLRETTERAQAREALRKAHDELEARVAARTQEAVHLVEEQRILNARLERYTEGLEETVAQRTRELQAERDRSRAILETLGDSVIVTDTQGQILYMNPATTALTGYPREMILGQRAWLWVRQRQDAEGEPWSSIRRTLLAGRIWRGEVACRHREGAAYDAAVTVAPLFDPDDLDQLIGSVWVQRDVTPIKEAERVKDQFISNVSHELRTPLSVITLTGDNLGTYYERLDDDVRRSMIQSIREQAGVLNDLIGDVLEISRIDSGRISTERGVVNLAQRVREEVEKQRPLAERRSQVLTTAGAESLPVWANDGQVGQIIRNLLDNAIKYTPEGGHIACTCRAEDGALPGVGPGPWAVLQVRDDGTGIAPEHLPHIFERFYRAHVQSSIPGTGLGLPIARELVDLHGGHLTVSSNAGEGSLFSVYLPLGEEGRS
ncbi:MAG: histidine kinase N-terminal 7TM domain-containing protein [Anaerolineae bacterium]